jgi:hypothetical protein
VVAGKDSYDSDFQMIRSNIVYMQDSLWYRWMDILDRRWLVGLKLNHI